jgi:glucose-6-phosphate isomerase
MAVLGIWYNNFFGAHTQAILPYTNTWNTCQHICSKLKGKQCKSVTRQGQPVTYATAPSSGGSKALTVSTLLPAHHQGTQLVPCDFFAAMESQNPLEDHHTLLLANYLAQTEALMKGRSVEEARQS